MTYQVFKVENGNLIMERVTVSQAARNLTINELKNCGYDVVVMTYTNGSFIGKSEYKAKGE